VDHPPQTTARRHRVTLVEMLAIVLILGVLASIVAFAVSDIGNKGRAKTCAADAQTIFAAIESYRASPGHQTTDDPTMAELVAGRDLIVTSTSYPVVTYRNHVASLPASKTCDATSAS
jgi:Tfp pilus assembly protein PilE